MIISTYSLYLIHNYCNLFLLLFQPLDYPVVINNVNTKSKNSKPIPL